MRIIANLNRLRKEKPWFFYPSAVFLAGLTFGFLTVIF